MVFVSGIKELVEATLLTDDGMRSLSATSVSAVKVATGLLVVLNLEDLLVSEKELCLAGVWGSMDEDGIGLILQSDDEELADVLDELGMLSVLHDVDDIIKG